MPFTDDFSVDIADDGKVAFRSSSRKGSRDFGVNKARVDYIAGQLRAAGMPRMSNSWIGTQSPSGRLAMEVPHTRPMGGAGQGCAHGRSTGARSQGGMRGGSETEVEGAWHSACGCDLEV